MSRYDHTLGGGSHHAAHGKLTLTSRTCEATVPGAGFHMPALVSWATCAAISSFWNSGLRLSASRPGRSLASPSLRMTSAGLVPSWSMMSTASGRLPSAGRTTVNLTRLPTHSLRMRSRQSHANGCGCGGGWTTRAQHRVSATTIDAT